MVLLHRELTDAILGAFYRVHRELGAGFAERVYERSLAREMGALGLMVESQVDIGVQFRGQTVARFRADVLVDRRVLLEIKARAALDSAHTAQLLNYLRASSIEVGLLLNFGARPEFQRLLFTNDRKGRGCTRKGPRNHTDRATDLHGKGHGTTLGGIQKGHLRAVERRGA
jgi:GxxExxY protein